MWLISGQSIDRETRGRREREREREVESYTMVKNM